MAERLIANSSINMKIIPDFLEAQIFENCLKLVFRIIDMLARSVKLRLCVSISARVKITKRENRRVQKVA